MNETTAALRKSTVHKLIPTLLRQAEFSRSIYAMTPEYGVTVEDLLTPEYWVNVGAMLRPLDRIEVTAEDKSYYVEILVLSAEKNDVRVKCLRSVDLTDPQMNNAKEAPGYEIKWSGNTEKHRITRLSDGTILNKGFQTKAEADQWLSDYIKRSG